MKDLKVSHVIITFVVIIALVITWAYRGIFRDLNTPFNDGEPGMLDELTPQGETTEPVIEESVDTSSDDEQVCIQVITPARNLETGEVREFSTPCDVPEGWERVNQ